MQITLEVKQSNGAKAMLRICVVLSTDAQSPKSHARAMCRHLRLRHPVQNAVSMISFILRNDHLFLGSVFISVSCRKN